MTAAVAEVSAEAGPGIFRWRPAAALEVSLLAVTVAAASWLRLVALDSNPGGLFTDEAAEGFDALRLLHEPGFHPVFFADDGGREALYGYILATVFRFFGAGTTTLHATAAGVGVAGVVGIWLLARRWGPWVGLAAAAWAAGSLWLICVSRDGFRNTMVPLFGALGLIALLHWCDRPSRRTAILAGAITALAAFYTYQPLKLIPLLLLIWLLWLRRANIDAYSRLRANLVTYMITFAVVILPMFAYALSNPANYLGRAVAVTPFDPAAQSDSSLAGHWLRTLGMFAVTGDPNQRHDVDGLPLLGWPLLLVALAGLWRLWRRRREPGHSLILFSLPLFLLPPLVATEGGSPHFLRALGLAAPLAVTIGLGITEVAELVGVRLGARAARLAGIGGALLLVGVGVAGERAYASRPVAERYQAFSYPLAAMAAAANHGPGYLVIADDDSAREILFLDADNPPTIVSPGTRVARPLLYSRVMALSQSDIGQALDPASAARATVVTAAPNGLPAVWAVTP